MMTAMRNMTAAYIVLGVVFYSFVVITTDLFRDVDPTHYGTLTRSAAHLYTVMVSLGSGLEAEPVLIDHPWALPVFAAFVLIVSFGLMNMFIAVLVTAMSGLIEEEAMQEERARFDRLERKVDALAALLEARVQQPTGD
jgi:voltage-gated sodium channel